MENIQNKLYSKEGYEMMPEPLVPISDHQWLNDETHVSECDPKMLEAEKVPGALIRSMRNDYQPTAC